MKTHLLHSIKALAATALIGGGVALTAPAYAISPQSDTVTTMIDVRDLKTDYGIAKVYESLERRAETACATAGIKGLSAKNSEKICAEGLLIDFVQDVGHDRLTQYHENMQS